MAAGGVGCGDVIPGGGGGLIDKRSDRNTLGQENLGNESFRISDAAGVVSRRQTLEFFLKLSSQGAYPLEDRQHAVPILETLLCSSEDPGAGGTFVLKTKQKGMRGQERLDILVMTTRQEDGTAMQVLFHHLENPSNLVVGLLLTITHVGKGEQGLGATEASGKP